MTECGQRTKAGWTASCGITCDGKQKQLEKIRRASAMISVRGRSMGLKEKASSSTFVRVGRQFYARSRGGPMPARRLSFLIACVSVHAGSPLGLPAGLQSWLRH